MQAAATEANPPVRRKVLCTVLVWGGDLICTNPEARQTTADLLRSASDAIAPESSEQKTLQERINQVLESK